MGTGSPPYARADLALRAVADLLRQLHAAAALLQEASPYLEYNVDII